MRESSARMGPRHMRRPRLYYQSAHGARRQRRSEQRAARGLRGRGRVPGRGGAAARGGRARRGCGRPRRAAAGRARRGGAALRRGSRWRAQERGHELGSLRGGQAAAAQRKLLPWGARARSPTRPHSARRLAARGTPERGPPPAAWSIVRHRVPARAPERLATLLHRESGTGAWHAMCGDPHARAGCMRSVHRRAPQPQFVMHCAPRGRRGARAACAARAAGRPSPRRARRAPRARGCPGRPPAHAARLRPAAALVACSGVTYAGEYTAETGCDSTACRQPTQPPPRCRQRARPRAQPWERAGRAAECRHGLPPGQAVHAGACRAFASAMTGCRLAPPCGECVRRTGHQPRLACCFLRRKQTNPGAGGGRGLLQCMHTGQQWRGPLAAITQSTSRGARRCTQAGRSTGWRERGPPAATV